MATVYLALGSNVGDSKSQIEGAIQLLNSQITDIERAPIYISKAVGYTDQADFFNTAIKGNTNLRSNDLLKFVKSVEQQLGRIERFRWGPREIDIDIVFYDEEIIEKPDLIIPHARFREREFVLKPLCDINSQVVDPITKLTIQELLVRLGGNEKSILGKLAD